jgi:ankyrin repeat protein
MGNSKSLYSKQEYLYYYIERNDLVNVNKLLEATPTLINDSLSKDNKHSALMRASYNGNIELTRLLLNLKAEVNYMTPKGETALTIAIKRNHKAVVQELIDAGAGIGSVSKIGLRAI